MTRLYLASQSPRRRQLLRRLGLKFSVVKPDVTEDGPHRTPREFAVRLAELKARSVLPRVSKGLILGVDTIVVLGSRILGKPRNKADARRMLRALSGRTHRVVSGMCLLEVPSMCCRKAAEVSRVTFRHLAAREIESYIATREPYDKAGAYAIQGQAGFFVERIEGDYFNIVGLPVARLLKLLARR
jgi:septum formation protein